MSEAIAQTYGFSELSPRDAATRPDLVTVDVRQAHELVGDLGHIPGVTHLPLEALLGQGPSPAWSTDTPLLVVCRSGARSAHAAMMLGAWGFSEVYNLAGGMLAWNGDRLPTSRAREDVLPAHGPQRDAR